MTVGEEHSLFLRTYLQGDEDGLNAQARSIAPDGLVPLVHTAFVIAARRVFAPRWTRAAVVRYVAETRTALSERPDLIDPRVAEHELRRALGDETAPADSQSSVAAVQLILLKCMIIRLHLNEAEVDALINQGPDEAKQLQAR